MKMNDIIENKQILRAEKCMIKMNTKQKTNASIMMEQQ